MDIRIEISTYQFTPAELARLAVYRAAVRAGYFNESLAEDGTDGKDMRDA
jgi:hypothetical protein